MKTRTGMLAAGLAMLLPIAGCAIDAPRKTDAAQALMVETDQCDYATGSRIRPRIQNECKPNRPLRSFSKDELDATGEIDLGNALRQLDPAFY